MYCLYIPAVYVCIQFCMQASEIHTGLAHKPADMSLCQGLLLRIFTKAKK